MDLRRARQQLDLVRLVVRHEASRLTPVDMAVVRARAHAILMGLEQKANGDPILLEEIAAVREEIG